MPEVMVVIIGFAVLMALVEALWLVLSLIRSQTVCPKCGQAGTLTTESPDDFGFSTDPFPIVGSAVTCTACGYCPTENRTLAP